MKISDIEKYLVAIRETLGDMEIVEAAHEYGTKEFTPETLSSFIRLEDTYRKDELTSQELVFGRH